MSKFAYPIFPSEPVLQGESDNIFFQDFILIVFVVMDSSHCLIVKHAYIVRSNHLTLAPSATFIPLKMIRAEKDLTSKNYSRASKILLPPKLHVSRARKI